MWFLLWSAVTLVDIGSGDDGTKCYVPRSLYRTTSTDETVAISTVGGFVVASRTTRWLPEMFETEVTNFGNWTLALGKLDCRTITMFSGFQEIATISSDEVWTFESGETWTPEPGWFASWFPEGGGPYDANA